MSVIMNLVKNVTESGPQMSDTHITEKTQESADRVLASHPDRVPVLIVRKDKRIKLEKCKYLVPLDITMGQLSYVIRKNMKDVKESEAMFFFISKQQVLSPSSALVSQVYEQYKDNGYLQLEIGLENTFG